MKWSIDDNSGLHCTEMTAEGGGRGGGREEGEEEGGGGKGTVCERGNCP